MTPRRITPFKYGEMASVAFVGPATMRRSCPASATGDAPKTGAMKTLSRFSIDHSSQLTCHGQCTSFGKLLRRGDRAIRMHGRSIYNNFTMNIVREDNLGYNAIQYRVVADLGIVSLFSGTLLAKLLTEER
jgi:hypothetical protein